MNFKPVFAPARVAALLIMFAIQIACAVDSGLLPRFPWPPMPERELNSWRFNDAAWPTNARTAPLAFINADFAPSWSGYALRMAGTNPAITAFAVTNFAGGTNLLASGSVRMWFAPDWASASAAGTGPGSDVVLFETAAWSGENIYVRCTLQIDADGDVMRWVLHDTGGNATILSTSLLWNWNEWHQIVLTISTTNTVLYLDGSAAASGSSVAWLAAPVSGRVNGFCVGSDAAGGALAQGNFDELYTFARALTAGEVAFEYNRNSGAAALGPINPEMMQSSSSLSFTNTTTNSLAGTSTTNMVASLYGCKLWLEITRPANLSTNAQTNLTNVVVTLNNTVGGGTYKLWTKQLLVATQAWALETNIAGAMGQNCTSVSIPMNGRSNLFFYAGSGGFFTNKSFLGLQQTNVNKQNPDAMGAVGPDHYLTIANAFQDFAGVAVYDKCSGLLTQSLVSTQFFAVQFEGTNVLLQDLVDARVAYDSHSQRWIALALAQNPQKAVILAVSKSSCPLDLATNWTKYLIKFTNSNASPDYPTLGVDENGIYLSFLQIGSAGGQQVVADTTIVAIKKPDIYLGTNISTRLIVTTNELPATIIQPAVNFDSPPRGQYAWFAAKHWRGNESNYLGGALSYRRLQWSNTTARWADTDTNWVTLTNSFYRDYFDLEQGNVHAPHTNTGFDYVPIGLSGNLTATGSRLMMAVIRDGALWTCHHVGVSGTNGTYSGDISGSTVDRTAAQWLKLSTDTNGNFLSLTNGRFFDRSATNPFYYYFPSLMVNRVGDMVTGFSGSHSNSFIGAFYNFRAANGTTPTDAATLDPGRAPYLTFGRWGDYSYTTLDPIDRLTFWTVQQYADDTNVRSNNSWGTIISEIVPNVSTP